MPDIDNYTEETNMIIVTIKYKQNKWQYFYQKEDNKIYLYSIYKEKIS